MDLGLVAKFHESAHKFRGWLMDLGLGSNIHESAPEFGGRVNGGELKHRYVGLRLD